MAKAYEKVTFLTGREVSSLAVAFENTAFYWGKSVFTTGLIESGKLAFFDAHEARLREAFTWLFGNKALPRLEEILSPLKDRVPQESSFKIRITLFENMDGETEHLVQISPYTKKEGENVVGELILSPVLSSSRPNFVKLGSYAETLRLKRLMNNEPIFLDSDGLLMEGAIANLILFHKKSKKWITPKSRFTIVEGLGLKVGLKDIFLEEKSIDREELEEFSAAFFVNCLKGVCPINSIDGQEFNDNQKYYKILQDSFKKSCESTGRELWQMEK